MIGCTMAPWHKRAHTALPAFGPLQRPASTALSQHWASWTLPSASASLVKSSASRCCVVFGPACTPAWAAALCLRCWRPSGPRFSQLGPFAWAELLLK